MIRPALLLAIAVLSPVSALWSQQAAPPATTASTQLQTDLQLERKLLALDLVSYREARGKEQVARDSVAAAMQRLDQALGGDSLALATLESLFSELSAARATAAAAAEQMDWQVRTLQERMRRISFLEGEVGGRGMREAGVAGRWQVQISPTNQTGLFVLQLSGTAISGTYAIQGGSSGSLRGDVVGNRLQLQLLDAAGELASTYTGAYDPASQRMGGTWLATELAAGQPAQGAWSATRAATGIERQP
ncbi:MAG TPA: hypothetical protein VEW48_19140 [Thermoanaerobaculia bacterium]|nr:hypothetical protein [Thermoanaerobaculia bacterium]